MFSESVQIIFFITDISNLTTSLISQVHHVFGSVYFGFWLSVPSFGVFWHGLFWFLEAFFNLIQY